MGLHLAPDENVGLVGERVEADEEKAAVAEVERRHVLVVQHADRRCGAPREPRASQSEPQDRRRTQALRLEVKQLRRRLACLQVRLSERQERPVRVRTLQRIKRLN